MTNESAPETLPSPAPKVDHRVFENRVVTLLHNEKFVSGYQSLGQRYLEVSEKDSEAVRVAKGIVFNLATFAMAAAYLERVGVDVKALLVVAQNAVSE